MKFKNSFFALSIMIIFSMLMLTCNKKDSIEERCFQRNNNLEAGIGGALLASRINSLEELKDIVKIQYYSRDKLSIAGNKKNDKVVLTYCNQGRKFDAVLSDGIKQGDILKAKEGGWVQKFQLFLNSPYSVYNYKKLKNIYLLSRRRYDLFGRKDVAFYDIAEAMVNKIEKNANSYFVEEDSLELGYINSFNHITAQALITTLYSEKIASFIGDTHERYAMPELINGAFTKSQLNDPLDTPIDNYIDLINNKCGQKLGKQLKESLSIDQNTQWDEQLLVDYLNEVIKYYSWSFQIEMRPFSKEEDVIKNFILKMRQTT